MKEISRRSFLRRLIGRGASAFAERIPTPDGDQPQPGRPAGSFAMAREGEPLEAIPVVHPWIAVGHAVAEKLGRRVPYILLLGGSGEVFRLSYCRDDPESSAVASPVNTFLASLALTGLTARAAHGGPFAPALGGIRVAAEKGLVVVLGTGRGPEVLLQVDEKAREIECVSPHAGVRKLSYEYLDGAWSAGAWSNGPAPYLRVTIEAHERPRPLDQIARVGLETMLMLLTGSFPGPDLTGLPAYEAWSRDLREASLTPREFELLHEGLLPTAAVSRAAAGRFLDAISRALPPDVTDHIEAAARCYEEVHQLSPTGEIWGTGLFPEVAECLLTDGLPDRGLYENAEVRARAADLLLEIRDKEAEAVEHIRSLPEKWRRAGGGS